MINQIECAFIGRIGNDPVQRIGKSGKPWLAFSVVVGSGDDAQWLQVALFGDNVPDVATRLRKGERVYVEGSIRLDHWTDKDGTERHGLKTSSFKVVPLGQIGQRRSKTPSAGTGTPKRSARHVAPFGSHDVGSELDQSIPF